MKRIHCIAFLAILAWHLLLVRETRADELSVAVDHALEVSATKAGRLADNVLVSPSSFTDYASTSGTWTKKTRTTWTSGFVPGIFWRFYGDTDDAAWLTRAQNWTEGVRLRATEPDNDTGFQIFCSFGLGYVLTGKTDSDYLGVLSTAAATFDTQRFNPAIQCYRSWTNASSDPIGSPSASDKSTNPTDMVFEVNIDQMMNLELPLFVGLETENQTLVDHVIAHADRTWETHVREDGSTFHVVGFNLDGSIRYRRTHQGWQTDSTWSRGQAWAVYGYTMVYRYTGLQRMLDRAEACLAYFLSATASQSPDAIPYSDFDAAVDSQNPRDTSAAAIVASAVMDLHALTGQASYLETARLLLADLTGPVYLSEDVGFQPILRAGSQKWGTGEVGTIFGDFYFIEAMVRYQSATATEPPLPTSGGSLVNISTRGQVGTGDNILIGGFTISGDSPQTVLIRASGPSLGALGVPDALADPVLQLFTSAGGDPIGMNDDWGDADNAADIATTSDTVGAFPFAAGSTDSAILVTLDPGGYTAQVSGKDGTTGNGIIEVYAVD